MFKKIIILCATCALSLPAFAGNNIFTDKNFGQDEFNLISKDLSSAFAHTTNSGGSSLGKIWGVEAGIVAGILEANNLKEIAEQVSGETQDELAYLPYAGIIAGVSLPFGIGGEMSMIPSTDLGDGSLSNLSTSLRWSVTDFIPIVGTFSPVKIVARMSVGKTEMDYTFSTTGSSTEKADFSIKNTEFGLTAGFNMFIVEPYIGLSTVKTKSTIHASTDLALPGVETDRTLTSDISGMRTIAGVLLKLPLLRIGLEYSNMQSSNRYTLKISLKI